MGRNTKPPEGSPDELTWLRGYEAGVIDTRNDFLGNTRRLEKEAERLRWMLRSYEQLGGDAERYAAQWREENPIESKEGQSDG